MSVERHFFKSCCTVSNIEKQVLGTQKMMWNYLCRGCLSDKKTNIFQLIIRNSLDKSYILWYNISAIEKKYKMEPD